MANLERVSRMESLMQFIQCGEGVHQDFKYRIDDQRKIARTLCAFANTDGGRLFIGVKDNGKVAGCNPEEEFHMMEGAGELFCFPKVPFSTRIWEEKSKLVLEVYVEKSNDMYHYALNEEGLKLPYIRIQDRTVEAGKIQRMVWSQKRKLTARPEKLDDAMLRLLELISSDEYTLSKIYRLSKMPLKNVDRFLTLFICWDLVEIVYLADKTVYRSR